MTKKTPNPTPEPLVDELEDDSTIMTSEDGTRTRIFQLKEDEVVIMQEHLDGVESAYYALRALEYIYINAPASGGDIDEDHYSRFGVLLQLIADKLKPAIDAL